MSCRSLLLSRETLACRNYIRKNTLTATEFTKALCNTASTLVAFDCTCSSQSLTTGHTLRLATCWCGSFLAAHPILKPAVDLPCKRQFSTRRTEDPSLATTCGHILQDPAGQTLDNTKVPRLSLRIPVHNDHEVVRVLVTTVNTGFKRHHCMEGIAERVVAGWIHGSILQHCQYTCRLSLHVFIPNLSQLGSALHFATCWCGFLLAAFPILKSAAATKPNLSPGGGGFWTDYMTQG